jgi:hypothetical protein
MEKTISERIIGCAYEVSHSLGTGFLEAVYENALCVELERKNIRYVKQKQLEVNYKGNTVCHYVSDIIVENRLILSDTLIKCGYFSLAKTVCIFPEVRCNRATISPHFVTNTHLFISV